MFMLRVRQDGSIRSTEGTTTGFTSHGQIPVEIFDDINNLLDFILGEYGEFNFLGDCLIVENKDKESDKYGSVFSCYIEEIQSKEIEGEELKAIIRR